MQTGEAKYSSAVLNSYHAGYIARAVYAKKNLSVTLVHCRHSNTYHWTLSPPGTSIVLVFWHQTLQQNSSRLTLI